MKRFLLVLVIFMLCGCEGHLFEVTYTSDKGIVTEKIWCSEKYDRLTKNAPFFVKTYEDSSSVLYKMNPMSDYFVPVYESKEPIVIKSITCRKGKERIACSWWFNNK